MGLPRVMKHLGCAYLTDRVIRIRVILIRFFPLALILSVSCLEPYDPPIDQQALNILVVEGFINASTNAAEVKLSHTQPIHDSDVASAETNAKVSIQASTGGLYLLNELEPGVYRADQIVIDKSALYTLHIKTSFGLEYSSDTIRIRDTPPIDSLSFGLSNDGEDLTIRVNTHDPSAKTRYYAWEYSETYEYNAPYNSGYTFVNKIPAIRKPEERIDKCWHTIPSSKISIGSTEQLTEDILSQQLLTTIPKGSPKISVRYSILVKQRAISAAEHVYLGLLRKTESLGGLFDTPPVSVIGNVHQVNDASVPVLGYFSGATVQEKRIFVDRSELPDQLQVTQSKGQCQLEVSCEIGCPPSTGGPQSCVCLSDLSASTVLVGAYSDRTGNVIAYSFVSAKCGDCREQGGTVQKPDFW